MGQTDTIFVVAASLEMVLALAPAQVEADHRASLGTDDNTELDRRGRE